MMQFALPVHVGPLNPPIPTNDLSKWRDHMVEMAISFMKQEGRFDAILLGVGNPTRPDGTNGQSMLSIPLNEMCETHEKKDALVAALPGLLEEMRCSMYIIVLDTFYAEPTPEAAEQYMRTGEMPKDVRRKEALMFVSEDVTGASWHALYRYDRDEHGAVRDIQLVTDLGGDGAQMTGRFTNLLRPRHRAPVAEA